MSLCKYKDMFGKPDTGVHSFRIFNIAVVDVVLTILLAFFISKMFHLRFDITLIVFFIVGIIAHRVFCVRTTIDKLLFPNLTKRVRFRD
jgi:hypothetical protein